jgi:predicted transcriptional regulator
MINEHVKKTEKTEIELTLLKEIRDHNGIYHKRILAKVTGYAEGTVLKYLNSLIDQDILKLKKDGRNQKLFVTEKTNKKIHDLEQSGVRRHNDKP